MRLLGYDVDFARLAGTTGPIELREEPVPGWTRVRIEHRARTLRLPPGVELDLGSTGKGLAADLAVSLALEAAGPPSRSGVLVSLGGDIATAGQAPEGGWHILVAEDSTTPADAAGEVIAIEGGAIATSTTTVRRWTAADGVTLHHIVDPRTGLPAATPWRTASVAASTCELANGASTAAIVLGEAAVGWLEATGLPARLVGLDGSVARVGGWPDAATAGA